MWANVATGLNCPCLPPSPSPRLSSEREQWSIRIQRSGGGEQLSPMVVFANATAHTASSELMWGQGAGSQAAMVATARAPLKFCGVPQLCLVAQWWASQMKGGSSVLTNYFASVFFNYQSSFSSSKTSQRMCNPRTRNKFRNLRAQLKVMWGLSWHGRKKGSILPIFLS